MFFQTFRWYYPVNVIKSLRYKDSVEEWEMISIGDSLYKPPNTFNTYICKHANSDSMIILEHDYNCDIYLQNSPANHSRWIKNNGARGCIKSLNGLKLTFISTTTEHISTRLKAD